VSDRRERSGVALVLLDIEGTTTPIAFVTDVLFPYARKELRSHLGTHGGSAEYDSIVSNLRAEHAIARQNGEGVPAWNDESAASTLASAATFVEWLMDRDRKSTPLKALQGKIWQRGYERGDLVGQVFPDVPEALQRWHAARLQIGIFSSGSVLAQQLLFRHSTAGDLTRLLQWHFDTRIGAKADPQSYRRIAQAVGVPVEAVLFLSDVPRELDAAISAGMQVRLVIRPGNAPVDGTAHYEVVRTFVDVTTLQAPNAG
jgi:enolase-phosphatase E1